MFLLKLENIKSYSIILPRGIKISRSKNFKLSSCKNLYGKNGKSISDDKVYMRDSSFPPFSSRHSVLHFFHFLFRIAIYFARYDCKKCTCFAEQNRETPTRILKPLIDPRDKTLLAAGQKYCPLQ